MSSAMVFNGTTTHASSSATWAGLNGATDFAVTWWQKRDTNQNARVINAQGTGGETLYIRFDGSGDASDVEFQANLTTTDVFVGAGTSGDFASDGTEWQHYACTYDGTNAYIYRNGVQVGTASAAGTVVNATSALYIGSYHSGGTPRDPHFDGSLRDMRIFTSGLTATQVTSVFEDIDMNGIGVTPVNWYYMEEGTGATLNDSGSANIDLGIVSGSWDASMYNLNQIGTGSVSGSVTVSGGTWNLRDSTYLDFNGSSAYCNVPSAASLDEPKTIAFWCRPDAIQGGANNIVSRGSNDYEIYFHSSTNTWWNYWGTKYSTGADGPPVGVGEWQHIVCTLDDTTSPPTVRWYKDGELYNTDPLNGTPAYGDDGVLNIGRDATEENDYFDGIIKDVMLYDSKLTDTQVELLFKGQWVGRPQHWWKLNEGTGNGADSGQNSSTAQTNSTTWVNPDYEIEMAAGGTTFMIEEDTTLSAPRGNLVLSGTTTTPTYTIDGIYTHNSGTMVHKNAVDTYFQPSDISKSGVNTFHKVKIEGNKTQWSKGSWNVEDSINLEGIIRLYANSTYSEGHTLTLGKTGSTGYVSGSSYMQAMTTVGTPAGSIIQGASKLYPAILSGTHSDYKGALSTYRSVQLGNLQFDGKVTNEGSMDSPVVTVINDVYFKGGYDVHNGETLVTTNQRAHFGANLDMESGVTFVGSGALLICDDKIKTDSATVYNSGTSVICGHAGTSTIRFNNGDWENLMYNPTGGGVCFDTNANVANNLIVAGGYYDMQTAHLSGDGVGKLQIATGGEFRGGDGTNHLITDTFNQAGGFIGQGAYTGDGANDNFMQIWNSDISDFEFGTGPLTIEAWVKASAAGGLIGSYWGSDLPMYQLDIGSGTATNMRILATGAGGASTDGLTQVDAPATTNVIDGKWHHVVGVRDTSAGLVKLYIDGKLESESSDAATVAEGGNTDNGQRKMVGSRGYYGELDGEIARASYWKVALTEAEIREMLFYDWVAVSGSSIDHTKCVGWYEFSDRHTQTSVTDMTGSGNTGTLSSTDLWAVGGTFTDDTCTLEFDNDGSLPNTYNFFMPRDGTQAEYWGITVTTDSALAIDNLDGDRDVKMYGPLVNSGATLTNRRNFQYYNSTGPVVDASSDLTVGNNTFYYFPSSAGSLQDAAGTTYSLFRPGNGADVTMQGDFTTTNGLGIYSDSVLHLNGYKGNIDKIQTYNSGNLVLDPGSTINFTNTNGFLKDEGGSNRSYITASGTNALLPNGNTPSRGNYFYTNAGPSTADGGAFGDSGSRKMSISMWFKTRRDANDADFGNNECVYGGNRGSSGEGSPQFTNYNATTLECRMHTSDPGGGGLGRAADVSIGSLSLDTWYHLVFTSEETGGNVVQNMYIHNADGTIFNTDTATGSGKTWYISSSYPAWWIWGKDNRGTGNSYYMGHGMAMADVRLYDAILTSGNSDTLSTECPNISPSYADSDNALGAITQWKLGPTVAPYQTSSYTDSVGSVTLTPAGNGYGDANYKQPKSGFATVTGSAGYKPMNNPYEIMTLTNTYMSGSQDIIVGRYMANTTPTANTNAKLITKGTVVLD